MQFVGGCICQGFCKFWIQDFSCVKIVDFCNLSIDKYLFYGINMLVFVQVICFVRIMYDVFFLNFVKLNEVKVKLCRILWIVCDVDEYD